ncbi:hypothetical protein LCGC14_2165750, partial [marine sediment metagenome]
EIGFMDEATLLGGHVDAVLDLRGLEINGVLIPKDAPEEESHIVVDYKSIRGEAFRKLVGPKPEHCTQMQIYLYLSGLKAGKFLYECKNSQAFREFLVVRDDEYINAQVETAKRLKRIVSSSNSEGQRTLPSRVHKKAAKEKVYVPIFYDTEQAGNVSVGGVYDDYEGAIQNLLGGVDWTETPRLLLPDRGSLVKLRNGDRVLANPNLSTDLPEIISDELFQDLKKIHGDDIMSESELAKVIGNNYEDGLSGFTIDETFAYRRT